MRQRFYRAELKTETKGLIWEVWYGPHLLGATTDKSKAQGVADWINLGRDENGRPM